jgi:hypothetical protein
MVSGIQIEIVDVDDDYPGVEIHASNARFAGSTRILAGLDELAEFAAKIAGFPQSPKDKRTFEFGSRDSSIAGGYGRFYFHCIDAAAHVSIDVVLEDDKQYYAPAGVELTVYVEAAGIDRFVARLRAIQGARRGEATLPSTA